jgi:hypothetical protein
MVSQIGSLKMRSFCGIVRAVVDVLEQGIVC